MHLEILSIGIISDRLKREGAASQADSEYVAGAPLATAKALHAIGSVMRQSRNGRAGIIEIGTGINGALMERSTSA